MNAIRRAAIAAFRTALAEEVEDERKCPACRREGVCAVHREIRKLIAFAPETREADADRE